MGTAKKKKGLRDLDTMECFPSPAEEKTESIVDLVSRSKYQDQFQERIRNLCCREGDYKTSLMIMVKTWRYHVMSRDIRVYK